MRTACSSSPCVTSMTDAMVRNGIGRGVVGSGPGGRRRGAQVRGEVAGLGRAVGDLAVQGIPLVVEALQLGSEGDVEALVGPAPGVEPAQHRRLHDLERVGRDRHAALARAHLRHAGDADEGVHRADGPLPAEDRREVLADDEAAARALVVDAGRLEDHVLVRPAHRPVDLPDELAVGERVEVDGLGVAALRAVVGQLVAVVVVGRDGREVGAARAAEGLERVVARLALAAVVLGRRARAALGLGGRGRLLLRQLRRLAAACLPPLPLPVDFWRAVSTASSVRYWSSTLSMAKRSRIASSTWSR